MEKKAGEKIMIVDDDRGILECFEILLGEDYSLIMADSGEKALRLLEKESPQLIFMDIYLPGIDGREILANIKTRGITSKVVVVTGSSDEALKDEVLNLGADDFIEKPFDIFEIEDIARTTLTK